jgi:hypothetical protein
LSGLGNATKLLTTVKMVGCSDETGQQKSTS